MTSGDGEHVIGAQLEASDDSELKWHEDWPLTLVL